MVEDVHDLLWSKFRQAKNILVVSHVRPDGDAVGALLAVGLGLLGLDKQVQMVLADGVPASFRHLEGADRIMKKADQPVDLVIALDCSDLKRVGSALDGYGAPQINIDHHVTNLKFGEINLVDPKAVATSEIITEHFEAWGFHFTPAIANALMSGIIADTLGFRTSNMSPKALRHAADLMEKGADLPEQYSRALLRRSYPAAHYWGAGLSSLEKRERMVWGTLRLADRESCAYPGNDDADLINIISAIDGFDISLIFVEQKNNSVKVSWRSIPGFDVSQLALSFGGGGHPAAAGADIPGTLDEIQPKVLDATYKLLESTLKKS
jgi:bifunctional oligoribonuclease and PAP phosphatase NrnA